MPLALAAKASCAAYSLTKPRCGAASGGPGFINLKLTREYVNFQLKVRPPELKLKIPA